MAERMYLVEARRNRRGDRPAAIARFILTAGSRFAALSKLRVHYDTSELDALTAEPVTGVIPIAGALVHEIRRIPGDDREASVVELPEIVEDEPDDEGDGW